MVLLTCPCDWGHSMNCYNLINLFDVILKQTLFCFLSRLKKGDIDMDKELKTQKDWEYYLKDLIKNNSHIAIRSMILIYCLQTIEEKSKYMTTGTNKVGFGKVDAEFMTKAVCDLKKVGYINESQRAIITNKMPKYWKQLMLIIKGDIIMPCEYKPILNHIKHTQDYFHLQPTNLNV